MKYLLVFTLCILVNFVGSGQGSQFDTLKLANRKTISIIDSSGAYYFRKEGERYYMQSSFKNSYGPKKDIYLRFLKDSPEFVDLVNKNLNAYRTEYGLNLIFCYNDYISSDSAITLNQDYLDKYGLVPIEEYRNGPPEQILSAKRRIVPSIYHQVNITDHKTDGIVTSSTRGEIYKLKFYYGNNLYKGGFAIKNLKKALGNDAEALKFVKDYRVRYFSRTAITMVGFAQVGMAIAWWAKGSAPFGLSTGAGIAIIAPAILFVNWNRFFPQTYKTRLINSAIDTYNKNLGF